MTFNKDLIEALESQIATIEKHMDENLDQMAKLHDRIEGHKVMNTKYLEQIKKLSNKVREMKERM